jgi:hypothetical protein
MTRSPESWRRICAVLDRVTSVDARSRSDGVAEACAAEGISVEDVTPYLDSEHSETRLPEQIDPMLIDEALREFAGSPHEPPLAPGQLLGPYELIALIGPAEW